MRDSCALDGLKLETAMNALAGACVENLEDLEELYATDALADVLPQKLLLNRIITALEKGSFRKHKPTYVKKPTGSTQLSNLPIWKKYGAFISHKKVSTS